jgi:hypothetical protein
MKLFILYTSTDTSEDRTGNGYRKRSNATDLENSQTYEIQRSRPGDYIGTLKHKCGLPTGVRMVFLRDEHGGTGDLLCRGW